MAKTEKKRVYVSEYYLQVLRKLSPVYTPMNDTDLVNHVLGAKIDQLLLGNPNIDVSDIQSEDEDRVSLDDELD
ncbi:hypothetical protein [Fischerella sp. PCC 9605]|uniref:hypothetical protein n=1 Tax=Fischerella sp. PCC 9605 TaxID=1173024 RepID=UPI00047A7735|nr:hypothetical protein [Fischerella sp. PCC 9605]